MNTLLIGTLVVVALLLVIAIVVFARSKNYIVALISIIGPLAYMAMTSVTTECNSAQIADPCNWKTTFLPISLGVTFLLMSPVIYLVLTAILKLFSPGKHNNNVTVG